MPTAAQSRAMDRVGELAGRGLDLITLWREAGEVIAPVVPHHMGLCWFTLDPASLLITSHWNPHMPELPDDALALEYYEDDVHDLAGVARSASCASTLHEAAGGDPSASPRWQANMAMGGDQELIAALRTGHGDAWGAVSVYREVGEPTFSADEVAFVRAIAPALGEGARRALLLGEARDPEGPSAPGLLCSRPHGTWSPPRRAWSGGCRTCPAATGTPAGCRRRCRRSRGGRCGRPRAGTLRARWRWRGS